MSSDHVPSKLRSAELGPSEHGTSELGAAGLAATDFACPGCGTAGMRIFHEARSVPTNNCILLPTRQEARAYPRGDIVLGFCGECGFITNTTFEPEKTEYSGRCEETQGFSPTFSAFHRELARNLVEQYDLRGKKILEIGCGKGEFLLLLCEEGANHGIGYDPAYVPDRATGSAADRVKFVTDFYSEKYASEQADFVCCKMTLEHIHPTAEFVGMVRRAIGDSPQTTVFFQVPDTVRILRDCAFEDVYYEHCSYFSPCSLGRVFRDSGFALIGMETAYDGQYLTIAARPDTSAGARDGSPDADQAEAWKREVRELTELVEAYAAKYAERVAWWRDKLTATTKAGQKAVIWGSGSKGVAFLSSLGMEDAVSYAVDINPHRHGSFMPGCGVEIVSPEFLREYRPDLVIIMNAIYRQEIGNDLQNLGLDPEIVAV